MCVCMSYSRGYKTTSVLHNFPFKERVAREFWLFFWPQRSPRGWPRSRSKWRPERKGIARSVSVCDLYIPRINPPIMLICGPNLGIYKSLTDTWMWKLGPRRVIPFLRTHKCDFRCIVGNRRDGISDAWWAARGTREGGGISVFSFLSPWVLDYFLSFHF
jgi:hypothetical protein